MNQENWAPFRRRPGARPLVLGHRGARAHAPENTFAAFDEALRQGAEGIELDVRMTADGELAISHDDAIEVLAAPHRVEIRRLSRAQLECTRLLSGERLPFLDQVLAWQKRTGALINVELKGDVPHPGWLARRAVEAIEAHGGEGLLLSSFHWGQVRALARALPRLPVALLYHDEQTVVKRLVPWRRLGASAVHPQRTLVSAEGVRRFHEQGALVNVWTVNDVAEAQRFADWGVDALITDSPRTLLSAL
ncbi:MAG TPA: glycerophosphodiester phosphodiesterase [Polyangiaceae bacterium]|nr:glycerophosphodiester phosphodiesterase [Polyangiaceae bacterium]